MTNKSKQDSAQPQRDEKKSLGKIRLDTRCLSQEGGGCPAEKFLYAVFVIIGEEQNMEMYHVLIF